MITKIYGASDDLIEIEGAISDEIGCYDHKKPIKFTCSDGTIGNIFYNEDGIWEIKIVTEGALIQAIHKSPGDGHKHTGIAIGCTSYSDVLILANGIEWVKIKGKTINKIMAKTILEKAIKKYKPSDFYEDMEKRYGKVGTKKRIENDLKIEKQIMENKHGGNREKSGAKKKPKGEKKVAVTLTVYGKEKHTIAYMRQIAKEAGQIAVDELG